MTYEHLTDEDIEHLRVHYGAHSLSGVWEALRRANRLAEAVKRLLTEPEDTDASWIAAEQTLAAYLGEQETK